jgi:hypothetical protein
MVMNNMRNFRVVRFGFESISPERAKQILLSNDGNRNLRPKDVDAYAKFMRRGSWRDDLGDPIHISVNGRLLNGQHRLNAVVLSGATIKFMVFYMEPIDGFGDLTAMGMPIDRGALRSMSDITGLADKAARIVSTMVRDLAKNGTQLVRDPDIILNCYNDLKQSIDYVLNKCNTSSRYYSQAPIKSIIILRHAQGYDFTEQYFNVLNHKYNLLTNSWNSWVRTIEKRGGIHHQPGRKETMCYTWSVTNPLRDNDKILQIRNSESYYDEIVNAFYGFCGNSIMQINKNKMSA